MGGKPGRIKENKDEKEAADMSKLNRFESLHLYIQSISLYRETCLLYASRCV